MQDCLREIAFLAAVHEFQIKMVHLESKANRISDCLSRWDLDYSHRLEFFAATQSYDCISGIKTMHYLLGFYADHINDF